MTLNDSTISLKAGWDALLSEHSRNCPLQHPVSAVDEDVQKYFQAILERIEYKDWKLRTYQIHETTVMQLMTRMPDVLTGEPMQNNSRMLPLCPNMSASFLVDLAFELIKEFELHEVAERFTLMGIRPYYPHDSAGRPIREVISMRARPPLPNMPRRQHEADAGSPTLEAR